MKPLTFAIPAAAGRGKRAPGDVSICINKAGSKNESRRQSLVFRFTMNAANKIAPNSEYASYAFDAETGRVYFIARDASNGFKLSKRGKRRVMTSGVFDKAVWEPLVGDEYKLLPDIKMNLYYIETARRVF